MLTTLIYLSDVIFFMRAASGTAQSAVLPCPPCSSLLVLFKWLNADLEVLTFGSLCGKVVICRFAFGLFLLLHARFLGWLAVDCPLIIRARFFVPRADRGGVLCSVVPIREFQISDQGESVLLFYENVCAALVRCSQFIHTWCPSTDEKKLTFKKAKTQSLHHTHTQRHRHRRIGSRGTGSRDRRTGSVTPCLPPPPQAWAGFFSAPAARGGWDNLKNKLWL
jgi:hypothetical protein